MSSTQTQLVAQDGHTLSAYIAQPAGVSRGAVVVVQETGPLYQKLDPKTALLDVAAAFTRAKEADRGVGVVGFCYGAS